MAFKAIYQNWALRITQSMPGDALSERVHRLLVSTLYAQPLSMAIGALTCVAASIVTAVVSGHPYLVAISTVLGLLAALRIAIAIRFSPEDNWQSTKILERSYVLGAFSFAFVLGLNAALTIWLNAGSALEVLMLTNSLCYGVGISARNAARPIIALGQLTLSISPVFIALLTVSSLPYLVIAINALLLVPAMASITMNIFATLRSSIASAEESEKLAEKMRRLARIDAVTGLVSRAGFNQDIAKRIHSTNKGQTLALFWVDIDRFKEINEILGHQIGDRLLFETARRIEGVSPQGSTIARFGSDEFIVLCDAKDRRHCEQIASEMHAEIMSPLEINGEKIEVGASIGVALLPDDAIDSEMLMQYADLALFHAKQNGCKQTRFYHEDMSRELVRKREIEIELREAIKKNELSIFFQPIVDLETGRIRAFEALVRWFHPQKGELRPDEFIPIAEETGVIVTLGNWVTAQAAKTAAKWPKDITLAVNLSSLQIRAPGAVLGIHNALRESGLEPHRLELEVTESLFLGDHATTESFIKELSDKGVRFALDDFGTGYSSLSYIHKYPFKKIKIDRSFVSGPDAGRKTNAIIHAVAELGRKLDMEIVAEGIENYDQVQMVRDAGCTLGQGYHFSRAVPDYLATMLLTQEREEHEQLMRASA